MDVDVQHRGHFESKRTRLNIGTEVLVDKFRRDLGQGILVVLYLSFKLNDLTLKSFYLPLQLILLLFQGGVLIDQILIVFHLEGLAHKYKLFEVGVKRLRQTFKSCI